MLTFFKAITSSGINYAINGSLDTSS